jgi:S-adenosylmethionine hydrolase
MPRPITFLSDYGNSDEFSGVCRAVIARICPEASVIDLAHGIRRHDVRQGAAVLANAVQYAPAGIHLAIVDPGVGTDRGAVAVSVAQEERILVGPDNGLLAPAIERLGGVTGAVEVSRSPVRLQPVSATFHGRDVFAPVAAHLAAGMSLGEVGDAIDSAGLTALSTPAATVEPAGLRATIGYVDGYGNATLLAAAEAAAEAGLQPGAGITVSAANRKHPASYAVTFADVGEGELMLYVDSSASLALAVNQGSAAERLGVAAGDEILLSPA